MWPETVNAREAYTLHGHEHKRVVVNVKAGRIFFGVFLFSLRLCHNCTPG
jgi:hypothetical protein